MNKIGLLVINYFNNYIGSFSISKGKTKYTIGGALILVFGIVFIFLFASMAISTMESTLAIINDPTLNLTDLEIKDYLQMPLYVNAGMLMMFTLLLTITKATSSKKNQDEDLLLSLPVTKTQIVTSKILFNYFFDFGMIASTILPSFIVYYVMCPTKLDIFYFGRVAFVILLIPMLSNAIGTLIGVLITFLTRKFVKANAIRSIIAVFFLVIFLFGYYALQFYIEIVAKTDINFSMSDIFVLKGIVEFVLGNSWLLYGIIIFLVCFIPFLICVLVSAISIGKHTKAHNSKKKELKFNKSSIVKTLFDQEIGKYFGSSVYVMNTLFGGIILIIISIIFAILGPNFITEKILTLMPANDIVEKIFVNLPFFIIGGTSLIISTIAISCVSISFEGKNIWILKTNPISYKKIFTSKILVNFVISLFCVLFSSLFLGIRFIVDYKSLGLLMLVSFIVFNTIISLLISTSGLLVNLIFPKLDWQSEVEVIKQSMSIGIGLLVNMFVCILSAAPMMLFASMFTNGIVWIGVLLSIVFAIAFTTITIVLLNTIGKKLYNKI